MFCFFFFDKSKNVLEDGIPVIIPLEISLDAVRLEFEPVDEDAPVRVSRISAVGCKKPPVGT